MIDETEAEKIKNLQNVVIEESRNGNVVVLGLGGLQRMRLDEFIQQSADGILYDLNRLEESIFFDNPRSVNDYAAAKTIRALKDKIKKLESVQ